MLFNIFKYLVLPMLLILLGYGVLFTRRGRVVFSKLVVVFLSILFALLAVEWILQWRQRGATINRWAVPDKRYGFIHRANFRQKVTYSHTNVTWSVRINSMGFRGAERDTEQPGLLKILLLGDSFTFGYGVDEEETFAFKLGECLEDMGISNCVMNAGVTGWGTLQEILFARDHLDKLKPDVVIMTYCENDPIEDEVFVRGGADGLFPAFPGKRFIRDHSLLYARIYNALYGRLYDRLFHSGGKGEPGSSLSDASPAMNNSSDTPSANLPLWWGRSEDAIQQFASDFKATRPAGLFFIQATEYWKPEIANAMGIMNGKNNVIYMDLAKDARSLSPGEIKLDFDPHWNPRMHSISAARLCREIAERR